MLSDRGRLSGVATDFLTSMAPRLAQHFQPLTPLYIPPLLRLLARPNKVYLRRAEKCVMTIVTHCPAPGLIALIKPGIEDKNEACRRSCGAALEKITREWPREVIGARGVVELEAAMKRMATEKDAEVRKIGKRMWAVFEAKWPERIEEFTAPLTPTIKKYLDISQSKSSTARTLFPATAPAARRARHPLAQTTTAPTQGEIHRPAVAQNASTTTTTVPRDRNMQAMRGLGRAGSTTTETTGNGIRPFLLRSTSAAVPSSSSSSTALRAGINRSVSVANVLGNEQLAEEAQVDDDDGSTEGSVSASAAVSATRPRVITHASTRDLIGSTSSAPRTQPAQRAAASGTGAGAGAVRRARVVSGQTHVAPAAGLGMGRPQGGAVRPTTASGGRVVSTSVTIGVGARSAGVGRAPVKPSRMVGQGATAAAGVRAPSDSGKVDGESQADVIATAQPPAAAGRTGGVKVITTNPGGTTKTRQFFRPTSSSATTHASSSSTRPAAEPRRVVGRSTTGGARSGGLTAPTASSGAKVVQRVLPDTLVPQTTGSSSGGATTTTTTVQQQQQAQAKPIVSPRRPRLKLKPPIPVFMPTSKARPASATATGAVPGARPRVKASTAAAVVVEPANVPLPESPAPRRVRSPRGEEGQAEDPFVTVAEVAVGLEEHMTSAVPRERSELTVPLATTIADPVADVNQKVNESESDHATSEQVTKDDSIQLDMVAAVINDCASAQTETPVEVPASQLVAEENSSERYEQTDKDTTETPAVATPAVVSADTESPIKVNLIDLDGPEVDSPLESVHVMPSPATRTPLGPAASPNQMTVPRKMATPKSKSPKIKQLSEFFENKAFSPEPSPERAIQLTVNGRRPSTTPLSTPPRPRVLN